MNSDHNKISQLPYRPCVGAMLLNKQKQVFVAHRVDCKTEAWQMPQGGIDDGETPKQALMRELLEEIGTNNIRIISESQDWLSYDLPEELIGKVWNGKYRGQRQKWFLLEFLGDDSEIDICTEHQEFNKWHWENPQNLTDIIVPFKKDLYQQIIKEFKAYL